MRIKAAMASMQLEIDAARKKGVEVRRLSRSVVLKRAGNVDKNTLKQPYHAELRKVVDAFVQLNALTKPKSSLNPRSMTETDDLGYYAQLLVAAQITRDEARKEAEELNRLRKKSRFCYEPGLPASIMGTSLLDFLR